MYIKASDIWKLEGGVTIKVFFVKASGIWKLGGVTIKVFFCN